MKKQFLSSLCIPSTLFCLTILLGMFPQSARRRANPVMLTTPQQPLVPVRQMRAVRAKPPLSPNRDESGESDDHATLTAPGMPLSAHNDTFDQSALLDARIAGGGLGRKGRLPRAPVAADPLSDHENDGDDGQHRKGHSRDTVHDTSSVTSPSEVPSYINHAPSSRLLGDLPPPRRTGLAWNQEVKPEVAAVVKQPSPPPSKPPSPPKKEPEVASPQPVSSDIQSMMDDGGLAKPIKPLQNIVSCFLFGLFLLAHSLTYHRFDLQHKKIAAPGADRRHRAAPSVDQDIEDVTLSSSQQQQQLPPAPGISEFSDDDEYPRQDEIHRRGGGIAVQPLGDAFDSIHDRSRLGGGKFVQPGILARATEIKAVPVRRQQAHPGLEHDDRMDEGDSDIVVDEEGNTITRQSIDSQDRQPSRSPPPPRFDNFIVSAPTHCVFVCVVVAMLYNSAQLELLHLGLVFRSLFPPWWQQREQQRKSETDCTMNCSTNHSMSTNEPSSCPHLAARQRNGRSHRRQLPHLNKFPLPQSALLHAWSVLMKMRWYCRREAARRVKMTETR